MSPLTRTMSRRAPAGLVRAQARTLAGGVATAALVTLFALLQGASPRVSAATGAPAPSATTPKSPDASTCPVLWRRTALRLQDEKPQDLCQYSGKVVLVVNTASYCGFTSQYKSLEALHTRYGPRGLVVLGFPSNDFSQEPGSNQSIAEFCENTFGVKFPMFAKTHVAAGASRDPLFTELARVSGAAPAWNFHKYLVARDGTRVTSHASRVDPSSDAFRAEVERLLAEPAPRN